jgi:beta-galactosidase
MVSQEEKSNLEAYVNGGGTLLVTFRSGVKDTNDNLLTETAPGAFAELAGVRVEEYDPQYRKETSSSGVYGAGTSSLWCDVIEPVTAKTLGVYTRDYYSGKPCLTVNGYGKGSVYYLGCDLDADALQRFTDYLCRRLRLPWNPDSLEGVEQVEATDGENRVLFLMNHNPYPVVAPLDRPCENLLDSAGESGAVSIEPYGVAVLKLS